MVAAAAGVCTRTCVTGHAGTSNRMHSTTRAVNACPTCSRRAFVHYCRWGIGLWLLWLQVCALVVAAAAGVCTRMCVTGHAGTCASTPMHCTTRPVKSNGYLVTLAPPPSCGTFPGGTCHTSSPWNRIVATRTPRTLGNTLHVATRILERGDLWQDPPGKLPQVGGGVLRPIRSVSSQCCGIHGHYSHNSVSQLPSAEAQAFSLFCFSDGRCGKGEAATQGHCCCTGVC